MLAFCFDEHIDPLIAQALRTKGIDVLTAQEAGRAGLGIPDTIQLAFAGVHQRVMVTGDWDFLNYAYSVHPHAGVVILPRHVDIGTAALYLELIASTVPPSAITSQLLVYPTTL